MRDERLVVLASELGEAPVKTVGAERARFFHAPQGLRRDFVVVDRFAKYALEEPHELDIGLQREADGNHV